MFRRKIDLETRKKIFTDSKFAKKALKMVEEAYKEIGDGVSEGEPQEQEYEMEVAGFTLRVLIVFFEKRDRRHCNFNVREVI